MALNSEKKRLSNTNFTILCNNCVRGDPSRVGGNVLILKQLTYFFSVEDYIKFLEKLDYYLSQTLVEVESDKNYPVAKLDDITIYFMHYSSFDEAKKLEKNELQGLKKIIYM